jgi:hypothetical protein
MPFIARAALTLPVSANVAFDRLLDYGSWSRWMPASFRPAGETTKQLAEGTRFRVKILGAPVAVSCRVSAVRAGVELSWRGGIRGVVVGHHRFLFEAMGPSSVRVESVETWSGPLAALLRPLILPGAVKVARETLAALAADLAPLN